MAIVRSHLEINHLRAAKKTKTLARDEERKALGEEEYEADSHLIRSMSTSSIVSSIAYLEAAINRLYCDAWSGSGSAGELQESTREELSRSWDETNGLRRRPRVREAPSPDSSILLKYQLALYSSESDVFDHGRDPFQRTAAATRLRNFLVHYTPEDPTGLTAGEPRRIEQRITRYVDPTPRLEGTSSFVNEYLYHGTAEWVLDSVLAFSASFFDRLGIEDPIARQKANLGLT